MAKPDLTKNYIADVFLDMFKTLPYSRITIQGIVEKAEINRKTFYYHFFNKADLITYIFRSGLARDLEQSFGPEELLSDTEVEDDKYRNLPFYTRSSLTTEEHDKSLFFRHLSDYFGAHDSYYRKLSTCEDWGYFEEYISRIYRSQFKKVILEFFAEEGVTAPEEDIDYLASYYTFSTVLWVLHRHVTKQRHYSAVVKDHLSNMFYDNIRNTVAIQAERIRVENR